MVVGFAITVAPVVLLSPVEGAHAYVLAPLAASVVLLPLQMVADAGETFTFGSGLTVTVKASLFTHPFAFVPVTV